MSSSALAEGAEPKRLHLVPALGKAQGLLAGRVGPIGEPI
jgi:hypothetical protein